MADDFYPFVDSGDPAPDNSHITGAAEPPESSGAAGEGVGGAGERATEGTAGGGDRSAAGANASESTVFSTRIAVYDDMLSTPRVVVVQPNDPRSYLEEVTNTVYRCMKEQGGALSLMVIREVVENFIHAHFAEPIVSILDGGNTIRFADQGPGIEDKERAFEFGVTSANRSMKRYIRGTGAGLPMVQQYLENAGGAISIEDNLGAGTVVTVSVDAARVAEIESHSGRGAAVRGASFTSEHLAQNAGRRAAGATASGTAPSLHPYAAYPGTPAYGMPGAQGNNAPEWGGSMWPAQQQVPAQPYGYPPQPAYQMPDGQYPEQPAGHPYPPQPYQAYPMQGAWPQPYNPYAYPAAGAPAPMQYSPGQSAQQSYQQGEQKFSTNQHQQGLPAEMQGVPGFSVQPARAPQAEPYVSERGILALDFIAQHGQCGPTELTAAYGHSGPTWSRELATLGEHGFITKHGRKYFLTSLGSEWLSARRAEE